MQAHNEPISVDTEKGWPVRIQWRRQVYQVREVQDYWVLQQKWWATEEKRVYFQVDCGSLLMEIYRRDDQWVLAKVLA